MNIIIKDIDYRAESLDGLSFSHHQDSFTFPDGMGAQSATVRAFGDYSIEDGAPFGQVWATVGPAQFTATDGSGPWSLSYTLTYEQCVGQIDVGSSLFAFVFHKDPWISLTRIELEYQACYLCHPVVTEPGAVALFGLGLLLLALHQRRKLGFSGLIWPNCPRTRNDAIK